MTRVRVGDVEVRTDADLSVKQIRSLLAACAGITVALGPDAPEPGPPLGFSAHLERLPDELASP